METSLTPFIKGSYQYDVFLSFSGEDTRKNFVDHLYEALQQHGIHTFKDDERLKKGESINTQLCKCIQESKFFIIVFSKKYASSSWCLNELVQIMECQKSKKQIAYPVFYDVDPSDVRKQLGPVGEALAKHIDKEIGKWKEALTEAANLSGWDLRNTADGREARVIKLVVEQISLDLRSTNVNLDDNLVGMEPRLQDLQKTLAITSNEVRMIGIKGMGGAGKTTLAKAAFDRISIHFEAKSFVENVREVSKASGLLSLQKQILSDLLNGEGNNISSVHNGTNMMKTKLRGKKALVVLDDVDHKEQLEALAGDHSWFKPGSRIIITTRDEQVLKAHKVKWNCDVNLLSEEEAISLFSRHAFGTHIPVQEYEKQSLEVVRYAAGLPLTIKVLGSCLCGKDKPEWIDAIARLNTIPLKETHEILELSFESLEDDHKEMFLDIACLLKGWEKDEAIIVLESCGFHARYGLRVLEQRSLITFEDKNYGIFLSMHDHIEEMGKNIVRRLHPYDPNEHSRLWIQEEIEDVLTYDLGTEATKCIKLELTPEIVLEGLGKMKKLRCLIIKNGGPFMHNADFVKIDEVSQYFPNALRYLKWCDYPHWCLPQTFRVDNLGELYMVNSKIEQLLVGRKVLKKLKYINLSYSNLRTLDLGLTPNLVRLELQKCHDLAYIHVPVGSLKRLVHLNLNYCIRLKSVSFIKELESLERVYLNGLRLKEFPDIIGSLHKLVYLNLSCCKEFKNIYRTICSLQHIRGPDNERYNGIEELSENIGQLEYLEILDLGYSDVKHLPDSICKLKRLKNLILDGCEVSKLPGNFGQIESLNSLSLRSSKIREIPPSISKLKHLKELDLSNCSELKKLPINLGDLEYLEMLNLEGTLMREIPFSICKLKHLKELDLSKCFELKKLPENLGDLECLKKLKLEGTLMREIPSSICKLKHLKEFDLSKCSELIKLPENLGDLEYLEKLNLEGTQMREIPSSICKLKHLKELDLSKCPELKKLPENLGDLECLEKLNLEWTLVREVPSSICKLKHLKKLNLSKCSELNKLHLGDLKCLEMLNLKGTLIREIPSSICRLKHLKTIDLTKCSKLNKLPENIGDLECLEKLNLEGTVITEIPSSICKLKHLIELNLSNCSELKKLPENLGNLDWLGYLNIDGTLIREIPSTICKLKDLKVLSLCECSELKKLPENLGALESLTHLDLKGTSISHLPRSISLLQGLTIEGYEKRIDPDALLSQEQQQMTHAPKRIKINNESTAYDRGDMVEE